jgi:hypothetical protein
VQTGYASRFETFDPTVDTNVAYAGYYSLIPGIATFCLQQYYMATIAKAMALAFLETFI